MKRIVNIRVALFCAIGIVAGIICGYEIMFGNVILPTILLSLLVIIITIFALFKNKLWISTLFVFIFAILGCGVFQLNLADDQSKEVVARQVVLTGRVTDIGRNGKVANVLYLEDCVYDEYKINGRVYVAVFDGEQFQTGDIVTLKGTLRSTYIFAKDVNTSYLRNRANYQLTDISIVSQQSGKLKLDESIRKYIYDISCQNMFGNQGVMYALLTGDTNAMDDVVKEMYKSAGIIHLIAVSGMHLVYIITIFGFFISRFKLHPMVEFLILVGPLVFFCYICAWAPSILRALLMTVCTYVVRWLCGRYDMLISLSWSVLLLLLIQPYYLFDIGWQLSVLSVFGMATLHLRIDRFLKGIKMPKIVYGLLSSISISFSCTLATFATIAHYFGEVPILGVFANIIAVPLMSWVFTLGVIGMLPWIFHYALHPADGIIQMVTKIAEFVSSLDFAVVKISAISLAILVSIVWLFVAGEYANLGKKLDIVTHVLCAVALAVCFVFVGIKTPCNDKVYVTYHWDGADMIVTSNSGEVVIVSNCQSSYSYINIIEYLSKLDYESCVWVFSDLSKYDSTIDDFSSIICQLKINKVYALDHHGNDDVANSCAKHTVPLINLSPNSAVGKDIVIRSVYDGSLSAVVIEVDKMSVAKVVGGTVQTEHFARLFPNVDIFVLDGVLTENYIRQNLVTFSLYQDYCDTNYGANKYGNFTILPKDDTIVVNFR